MLKSLHVKDLAIIDEAQVEFGNGLNVITGETGAGKSMVIGSVNIALGGKFSKEMIRNGADSASVEMEFEAKDKRVDEKLEELELPVNSGSVLISRRISESGKSVIRINGEQASVKDIKELSPMLINIHGQREHFSLLSEEKQLKLVDDYAGKSAAKLLSQVYEEYKKYSALKEELSKTEISDEERLRELSYIDFALSEIDAAALKEGEEEELAERHKILSNSANIREALGLVYSLISEGNENASSVYDSLGEAQRAMSRVSSLDEKLSELSDELFDAADLIDTFSRDVNAYLNDMDDGEELSEVTERLDLIREILKKYGGSVENVLKFKKECEEKKQKYEDYENYQNDLKRKLVKCDEDLKNASDKLSKERKKAAKELSKKIEEALIGLNFLSASFEIRVLENEKFSSKGTDSVCIYLSTNPGQKPMPMDKVASGGELSRIMLAIKSVLADKDDIEALIFDEIDTGISGRTAEKVAEMLSRLGMGHQVICITHLPQIASMADTHYMIEKHADGGFTASSVYQLDEEGMVQEIARLTSGAKITESGIENAREMKKLAKEFKKG